MMQFTDVGVCGGIAIGVFDSAILILADIRPEFLSVAIVLQLNDTATRDIQFLVFRSIWGTSAF